MHRRDGKRRSPLRSGSQPVMQWSGAGTAGGQPCFRREEWMDAGCFFPKRKDRPFAGRKLWENLGNGKNPLRARAEDFCFPGQGSRRNAVPLVRGAGGETSGAGQGRQTLVWVQGGSVLLRVEGGKPRPIGLLFTAARIGYYLPKMEHKNPAFARQGHLRNQQNCKNWKPWFQEKRRKDSSDGKQEK